MDEVAAVNLNLSAAELVVLAEYLEIDPLFGVGERSEAEMDQLKAEGWRSLLARRFVRHEEDSVLVSTDLAAIAQDVLAPLGLLTYSRVAGDVARISHVFAGRHGLFDATVIAEDVAMYSDTDVDRVVNSIVGESEVMEADSIHRLETIDGRTRESNEVLIWVQTTAGGILVDTDDGAQELTTVAFRDAVSEILTKLEGSIRTAES